MRPSYDELVELVAQLRSEITQLRAEVHELKEENSKLKERLGLNSENSSKPSSTDQKKNKQKPKGGAREGHPGSFRKLFDQVDQRVTSTIEQCDHCGGKDLIERPSQVSQQVDIPDIKPLVTQIECHKYRCQTCGKYLVAPFPEGYDRTSFGPKLVSFIGLCSSAYRMSKRTIQAMLKNLLDIEISLGSIPAMERKVGAGLEPCFESLISKVNNRQVAYVDETSFRQEAQTCYVWTAITKEEALIRILPTRGLTSLDQIRPRSHKGITVTDRYQVYAYKRHQYCLAHLYRDFKKFAQRDGPDGELGKRALFEMDEIFKATRAKCRKTMQTRVGYRKRRLEGILEEAMANGSDSLYGFANRLLNHYEKLFLFTRYQDVEATNNAAERSLRHIVLWRKTSYGTQSEEGSRFLERAVSIWMTLKKQKRDILGFLEQAYLSSFDPRASVPVI
jgi:transposase